MIGRDDSGWGPTHWWLGCHVATGRVIAYFQDTSQTDPIVYGPIIQDEKWHHLVFIRNANDGKEALFIWEIFIFLLTATNELVIDKNVFVMPAFYDGTFSASNPVTIGWMNLPSVYQFTGYLDNVAFYSRGLTQQVFCCLESVLTASNKEVEEHFETGRICYDNLTTTETSSLASDTMTDDIIQDSETKESSDTTLIFVLIVIPIGLLLLFVGFGFIGFVYKRRKNKKKYKERLELQPPAEEGTSGYTNIPSKISS